MKKTLLPLLLLVPALMASSKSLTPEEALARVSSGKSSVKAKINRMWKPVPVATVNMPAGTPALYVFSEADGFMVVSAEDCAVPLLGYSDSGSFNPASVPPGLKYWLDFYASQIDWGKKHGVKAVADGTSADYPSISPLTKSKWDQGAPYNDDCPLDNGKRSVTGCVATAMAQAMYYHQWPAKGTGSHSYSWNNQTLTVDFGETTYDWSAMTPTYDDSSSTSAKEAVANLMYSCGVSVDMNYTSDESGASSMTMVSSLYKYFNYDRSMTFPQRSFYGEKEWEEMVYDQLSQGLPVLYCGQSGEGGHQFICDGYQSDGYFHFNWGWSGMSDGYYLLSALDPLEQGIGGSASDAGFNYDQGIVLNMKPAQTGSTTVPLIYCYGNFSTTASGAISLGSEVEFDGDYFNFACSDIDGYMGVKLTDSEGNVSYLKHDGKYGFGSFSGYKGYTVTLPSALEEGVYTVTPVFMSEGSSSWVDVLCPLSGVQALTMTVEDGMASFADDLSNQVEVTSFTLNSPIYLDQDFSATFTLANVGTSENFSEYVLYLLDGDGNKIAAADNIDSIDLQPGETTQVNYIAKFPSTVTTDYGTEDIPAGQYQLALYTHFTDRQIYLYPEMVNVSETASSTSLSILSLTVGDNGDVFSKNDVKFTGEVECTSGYFGGKLKIAVFKEGSNSTTLTGSTDYVFISEGETADFTAHVDISSADGDSFFAVVFNGDEEISDAYPFKIDTSGISASEADGHNLSIAVTGNDALISSGNTLTSVSVFSVDGTLIRHVAPTESHEYRLSLKENHNGVYVISAEDSAGHSIVRKILR